MLILCIVLFGSSWLISSLSLIISCLLFLLGVFASFYSRAFRYAVKLVVYDLSSFLMEALRVVSFPLSNAFLMSYKFWYVIPSLLLNSKKTLISFFIFPWIIFNWVKSCSAFMCMLACCCFRYSWRPTFVHGDMIGCFRICFNLILFEVCFVTNYMVSFEEGTMRCWEECIFFF